MRVQSNKVVDPITVQILRNRIGSLMDEMHHHFFRSGYSTIVRESRDFSCVILDAQGRLLVAPPMFFHSTAYRYFVKRIFELVGDDGLCDGDVFISNHPYDGSMPHVPDPLAVFDEMIAVAQYAASELSGELRDPDGGKIGESGVEKIRQQVTDIEELFHRVGIVPGSEEALRLF